jgi:hypothetical protein
LRPPGRGTKPGAPTRSSSPDAPGGAKIIVHRGAEFVEVALQAIGKDCQRQHVERQKRHLGHDVDDAAGGQRDPAPAELVDRLQHVCG